MEVAAVASTTQIWDKGYTVIILFIVGAFAAYVNIHNNIAVLVGSFLVLLLSLYIASVSKSLPYPSIRNQIHQLATFVATATGILVLTIFSQVFSLFVAVNGTLTIVTMYKLIVCIVIGITLYSIMPVYLWLYFNLDRDFKDIDSK